MNVTMRFVTLSVAVLLAATGLSCAAGDAPADPVARFVRKELQLDLSRFHFGASRTNFPDLLSPGSNEVASGWQRLGMTAPLQSSATNFLDLRFDADRLVVTGGSVPVQDGIFMCPNTGTAHFSLAANGTLAYAQGMVLGGERQPLWVDRQGKAEPLPMPARPYLHPRLSPDGKLLAIEIEGPTHDFWVFDLSRGTMTKVSLDGSSHWPLWTPDGSRLTYRTWSQGHFNMWWMPSDRSAAPERILEDPDSQSASSWSPDACTVMRL